MIVQQLMNLLAQMPPESEVRIFRAGAYDQIKLVELEIIERVVYISDNSEYEQQDMRDAV